jgi:hypothetical protein
MNLRAPRIVLATSFALLGSLGLRAQDDKPVLDPELRDAVTRQLAAATDPRDEAMEIWQRVVLRHGDVEELLADLEGREKDETKDDDNAARRLRARILRIRGDLAPAAEALAAIPEGDRLPQDLLSQAEILDAQGKVKEAIAAYEAMLAAETEGKIKLDGDLQKTLRLRIALMRTEKKDGLSALALFAKEEGRTLEQKNQAAVALALRNEPKVAIELFEVTGEGSARYRRLVRLAEWAIDAQEFDRGQSFAWEAVKCAKLKRDRRYALTLLVETYRRDKALPELVERFEKSENLDGESRSIWIDLLRELGQVKQAAALFEGDRSQSFSAPMRRELLEMSREAGDEAALIANYQRLIDAEPSFIEWREGLSRYFLEKGERERGAAVWKDYAEKAEGRRYLMAAAATAAELGLADVAERLARSLAEKYPEGRGEALLFLFETRLERGRRDGALDALDELDRVADPDSAIRKDLAEGYDRMGRNDRSVAVLEALRASLGARAGTDLEMKLALELSEVDREDEALELWQTLWRRTNSVPRRRYVEDRMMTVASRLGKLARIAVNIERKLSRGEADDLEAGLLVRLYTRVNDPVSATEVIEEHMAKQGKKSLDVLAEKSRIFMSCEDFYNYEKTIEQMIADDPENRGDYLRQLAMSKLERGKRDEAREILAALKKEDATAVSDEFEAGVLAIAGLRAEAAEAYRRGLARHPERIDGYLLLSNIMKELGRFGRSAGMFQYLAATAEKDDLFTIAIDGILNMRDGRQNAGAPDSLVKWARRVTLERLARRPDKFYLYQLVADLSEEVNDSPMAIRSLKAALPIAGERRTPLLRELMTMSKGRRNGNSVSYRVVNGVLVQIQPKPKDLTQHLMFGRRLVGQGELVPPGVYLELGEAFLQDADVDNAMRTFNRASKLPEFQEMRRDVAKLLVKERFPADALEVYRRILSVETEDIAILRRVANLEEQLGRDEEAQRLYRRAFDIYLRRKPPVIDVAKKGGPKDYFGRSVNQDASESQLQPVTDGLLSVVPSGDEGKRFLFDLESQIEAQLELVAATEGEKKLERFPRLAALSKFARRATLAMSEIEIADRIDARLIQSLPDDDGLARVCVNARLSRGYAISARSLVDRAVVDADLKRRLMLRAGGGGIAGVPGLINIGDAANLMLPALIDGRESEVKLLLARLDLAANDSAALSRMPILLAAAAYIGDEETTLSLLRVWLDLMGRKERINLYAGIEAVMKHAKAQLSPALRRDFVQHLVDAIVEKPERFRNLISRLSELQKSIGGRLLDDDQAEKLIRSRLEATDRFIYGIPELFALLTPERRESTLRAVWSSVPKGQRAFFVTQVLPVFDEPVTEAFSDFLAGAFETSYASADDKNMFQYYVPELAETASRNLKTAVRLLETYAERNGDTPAFKLQRQLAYAQLGEMKVAVEFAKKELVALYEKNANDYRTQKAQREFRKLLVPHTDELLTQLKAVRQEKGDSASLARVEMTLLQEAGRQEAYLAALRRAVESHPDESSFRGQLEAYHRMRGELLDVLALQRKALERKPEDKSLRAKVENTLRSLSNPIEALAVRKAAPKADEGEGKDKGKEGKATSVSPGPLPGLTSIVSSSGGAMIVLGVPEVEETAVDEEEEEEKGRKRAPVPTAKLVKESLAEEKFAEARRNFRRLWRLFPQDDAPRYYSFSSSGINTARRVWPKDEEKKKEEKKTKRPRPSLGGMPRNFLEDVEPPKKPDPALVAKNAATFIHKAIAEVPFAEDEFRRQLRLLRANALDGAFAEDIYAALATMAEKRLGRDGALAALLEIDAAGRAGKPEYGVLFELLERAKDAGEETNAEVLERLLATIPASDTEQLRRVARLFARADRPEEAEILYRWSSICPPVIEEPEAGSRTIFRSFGGGFASEALIREIEEVLEGERRLRVIEAVLASEEPDPSEGWGRERWMTFVFRTWQRLLGPEEALARTEPLIAEILERRGETPPRNAAKLAVEILVRAGDLERARRCFEVVLAKLEAPADLRYQWSRNNWESGGYLDDLSMRKIFPATGLSDEDQLSWPAMIADDVMDWLEQERIEEGRAQRLLALLSVRLHQAGDSRRAARLLDRLEDIAQGRPGQLLWVADVARANGNMRRARKVEIELFHRGALIRSRIPRLMNEVLEDWGANTLVQVALPVLEFNRHPAVLGALIEAAMITNRRNLLERCTKLEDEADQARREYARIAAAAKKKKEEEAAKKKAAEKKAS